MAPARMILVGDLNVAPLEHDVWSHKQMLRVVSHTPIECEKLVGAQKAGVGSMPCACWCRSRRNCSRGGAIARPTGKRPTRAGDSTTSGLPRRSRTGSRDIDGAQGFARVAASLRSRAGHGDTGAVKAPKLLGDLQRARHNASKTRCERAGASPLRKKTWAPGRARPWRTRSVDLRS